MEENRNTDFCQAVKVLDRFKMQLSSRGDAIVATLSIFLAISYIFVLTRLYVRKFMVKKLDLDDLFLLLTLVNHLSLL